MKSAKTEKCFSYLMHSFSSLLVQSVEGKYLFGAIIKVFEYRKSTVLEFKRVEQSESDIIFFCVFLLNKKQCHA